MATPMKWICLLGCLLGTSLRASAEDGITLEIHPPQVHPGEVFEMRVVMDRPDFARFTLQVPPNSRLHRIAVGKRSRCVQRTTLPSDRKLVAPGQRLRPLSIEGGIGLTLKPVRVCKPYPLPSRHIEVVPFETADANDKPQPYPIEDDATIKSRFVGWWAGGFFLFLAVATAFLWKRKVSTLQTKTNAPSAARPTIEKVLEELESGTFDSIALERLMESPPPDWPENLRLGAAELLYAQRGDPRQLAARLRKTREVGS